MSYIIVLVGGLGFGPGFIMRGCRLVGLFIGIGFGLISFGNKGRLLVGLCLGIHLGFRLEVVTLSASCIDDNSGSPSEVDPGLRGLRLLNAVCRSRYHSDDNQNCELHAIYICVGCAWLSKNIMD